jgi:plastocyanin
MSAVHEGETLTPPRFSRAGDLLGLFLVLALAACGGDPPQPDAANSVLMYDNAFNPPVIRIGAGEPVTWKNVGRNPHNAVADDSSWSTEVSFGNIVMLEGAETSIEFSENGVFPYFCTFHGAPGGVGMAGVVVVGDVEYTPDAARAARPVAEPTLATRRVPQDYPFIQSAVDAAAPGDLILVDRGVYREEVTVTTPSLVIRGVDRNDVVVDGEFVRGNGFLVLADGVAIENMTSRNNVTNGFFWTGVTGFRGSYLTAYNNGTYGVYAFDSSDGLFEHSYASASPDSGFYVGQCQPCRTVLTHLTAERNALGYSGTNAGGELYIASSVWRNNGYGILPNTLDSELLPPQRGATVVANLVVDNNYDAPTLPLMYAGFENGISVAGGLDNVIERNVVIGHRMHGISVTPGFQHNFWPGRDNVIRNNVVRRSGRADLSVGGPVSGGNCFEGNDYETSAPPGLETFNGCGGLRLPLGWDVFYAVRAIRRAFYGWSDDFTAPDWKTQPLPPPQAQMPEGADAPVRPAFEVFNRLAFDPEKAELPPEAAAWLDGSVRETTPIEGMGILGSLLWRWSYYLPFAGLALGVGVAVRGRFRRGALIFLGSVLFTLLLAILGGWLHSGVPG